jgi:hypothetical protein
MRYLLALALSSVALLSSCAGSQQTVEAVLSQPVDTTVQHQVEAYRQLHDQLQTGRVKIKGPVTFQFGGIGNSANATDATKARGPVAAAPGAVASAPAPEHGQPWAAFVATALGSVVLWEVLRRKVPFLKAL